MKILVKFPTRSRPLRFFRSLATIYDLAYNPDQIFVLVTADVDDKSMNNDGVIAELKQYSNRNLGIIYSHSKSKVHAINRDMELLANDFPAAADWDILVVMSDDMVFTLRGWDEIIRVEMQRSPLKLDTLLHFPDQDAKHLLAVMYIAGRRFYDRFGYIYNPAFKSLFCDNLVMDIAIKLGKYRYVDYKGLFIHLNPAYGHLQRDAMFDEQQNLWGEDENMYQTIKARGYDLHKIDTDE
jgi:hypothetical protein